MAAATNLFKDDVALLRSTVDFGANVSWNQVRASVKRAERTYLRETFGSYYTNLLTKLGADTLDAADEALLDEMRLAAANLAWWLYSAIHNISISSTGFHQTHGDNEKPAFQWAVKSAVNSFRDAGFEAIENTFEFLEANAGTYTYDASDTAKKARGLVLDSVQAFEDFVDIVKSRYLFQRMLPEMKRVQNDVIAPIIGVDAWATLVKKLQKDNGAEAGANDLSDAEKAQLALAKPILAYATTADVLRTKQVLINEYGILVHNSTFAGTVDGVQTAQEARIESLRDSWQAKAQAKINALEELINPPADKTETTLDAENLLDPDDALGAFI